MAAEIKVSKADRASIINEATDKVLARLAQLLGAPAPEAEDDTDSEDEEEKPVSKKAKKCAKADSDDEENSDSEEDETDDEEEASEEDEESEDESSTLDAILAEMKSIPDKTIARAKKESAAAPKKEKLAELRDYLKARGASKTEISDALDELDDEELNGVYADYYSRFLDTKGEVHATDEPYDAIRIVKGKEKPVRCCNGVPMEDGVCAVNPKIKDKKAGKKAAPVDEDDSEEESEDEDDSTEDSEDEEDDTSDDEDGDDDSSDDEEEEDADEEEDEKPAKKRGRPPVVKKKGKK